jgi:undecaprenyl pyrophosphate phosphatase UppP
MGTPIILGAGVWKARELFGAGAGSVDVAVVGAGMLAALLAGLLAIWGLLAFLRRFSTDLFSLYRVAFAALAAVLLLSR